MSFISNIKYLLTLSYTLLIDKINIISQISNNITTSVITEYNNNNINYNYIVIKWLLTTSIIINIMQYINTINDNNLYKIKKHQTTNTNQ